MVNCSGISSSEVEENPEALVNALKFQERLQKGGGKIQKGGGA